MEILIGVVTAVLIALTMFVGKWQKGEEFQLFKLARTVAVGVVLGLVAHFTDYTITAENYQEYIIANVGLIGGVDVVVKVAYRFIAGLFIKS